MADGCGARLWQRAAAYIMMTGNGGTQATV